MGLKSTPLPGGPTNHSYFILDEPYLVQHPTVMVHDAAMAYLGLGDVACFATKTQAFAEQAPFMGNSGVYPSGFSSILDCGARSLDLRLGLCSDKGNACMHHGMAWLEDQTFEGELPSIVQWASENPDELVLLKIVPDNDGDLADFVVIAEPFVALGVSYPSINI